MKKNLTFSDYIDLINTGIYRPYARLELLRQEDETPYDSFTSAINDGSTLTVSNQNGCRRSINLVLDNNNGRFIPNANGTLWVNTRFSLSLGLADAYENIYWIKQGIFVTANSQPEVMSDTNGNSTVNLKADDKWSILNNPCGAFYQIARNSSVTEKIQQLLQECNDPKTAIIQNLTSDLAPYDLTWNPTDTYGKILKDLANFYSRDIYYNEYGNLIFETFQDISTLETIWSFSTEEKTYLGATRTEQYDKVVNDVFVYSSGTDSKVFHGEAINSDLMSNTRVGFIPIHRYALQDNNLISDAECQQRATYELSKQSIVQETITIKSMCLPHFTVNKAFELTDPKLGLNKSRWAIQSFQIPLGMNSEMSTVAYKYNSSSDFQNFDEGSNYVAPVV